MQILTFHSAVCQFILRFAIHLAQVLEPEFWSDSDKILNPLVILSMEKTVVGNVISELKTVYDAKYAKRQWLPM